MEERVGKGSASAHLQFVVKKDLMFEGDGEDWNGVE